MFAKKHILPYKNRGIANTGKIGKKDRGVINFRKKQINTTCCVKIQIPCGKLQQQLKHSRYPAVPGNE